MRNKHLLQHLGRQSRRQDLHPLMRFMTERRETIEDLATRLGVTRGLIESWTRKVQPRRISAHYAWRVAVVFEYANTPENWPNGIRP